MNNIPQQTWKQVWLETTRVKGTCLACPDQYGNVYQEVISISISFCSEPLPHGDHSLQCKDQYQHDAHQGAGSHCYDTMKHHLAQQNQGTQEYWALTQEMDQN